MCDRVVELGGDPRALGDHAAPAAHEWRAAPRIEVALAECERLLDTHPGAPQHDDERPQASAVAIIAG